MGRFIINLLVVHVLVLFSCKHRHDLNGVLASPSIATDREALFSFKAHIIQNPVLSTWNTNLFPCNWTGILCNRQKPTRVVGLQLSGVGLTGPITPFLGNMSFLRTLELQNNRLTGNIPDEIGHLFHLKLLNLSSNSLGGIIPPNISQCKELTVIDLKQNQISGSIPEGIGQLQHLQVINLGGNHLSGAIPPSISNASSLVVLNLRTNNLVGEIPQDLAKLRLLKVLELTVNHLSGAVPPSIYNMSTLEILALASNNLWGDLPGDVGMTLPNLLVFNFCLNKFTGTIPGSLHNLTNIKVIRMASNYLHGTIPPGLGNLPFLEMYNIGHNMIVSSGDKGLSFLELLSNSLQLKFLAFDYNLIEGVIPESIGNLSKVLRNFYMGGNRIHGRIPPSIGQLSGLTLFDLHRNSISGEIPPEIGELKDLEALLLSGNRFSGGIPSSLGNLRKLISIDLSQNELVGSIPISFGNFRSILSLDLSKNMLNGSLPKHVLRLPSLSAFLNLSQNHLTGSLPQEIGNLENVVTIDISHNLLSGSIPRSIGKCKSLQNLLLSNNVLSGQIPDTITDLKGLEALDVSSNHLSGKIPIDMQELQALQLLNLSHNDFEGQVPCKGIFADPSKLHLEGNQNLASRLLTYCASSTHGHRKRSMFFVITIPLVSIAVFLLTTGVIFYIKRSRKKANAPFGPFRPKQHQMITYDEIRLATDNFTEGKLIGKGGYGSVYKAFIGGRPLAVKVLNTQTTGYWKSFSAECAALKNVRHRNLVKLITVCSSIDVKNMDFFALVFEFMENGSLEDWITKKKTSIGEGLNLLDRLGVAIDVACALNYLHHECETPIVHCDLKPGNVLLDINMTAKVGDFGLARSLNGANDEQQPSISSNHVLKGSIGYIPPEYGLGEKPTTAGDVYSYGILLLDLFTGKSPTDESFKEGLSLRQWVNMDFPVKIEKLVDTDLLPHGNILHQTDHNIVVEIDCLITIVGVGLSCTLDSPSERITINDALLQLKSVRDKLLKSSP